MIKAGRVNISVFSVIGILCVFAADFSVFTLLAVVAMALHEAMHLLFLKHYGVKIEKINVYPFGIDILADMRRLSYKAELLCVLAGYSTPKKRKVFLKNIFSKKQLTKGLFFAIIVMFMQGEVSERFKEPVLKTGDSKEPRVRIPSSPPHFFPDNFRDRNRLLTTPGFVIFGVVLKLVTRRPC